MIAAAYIAGNCIEAHIPKEVKEMNEVARYHVFNESMDLFFNDLYQAEHYARLNAATVVDTETDEILFKFVESFE